MRNLTMPPDLADRINRSIVPIRFARAVRVSLPGSAALTEIVLVQIDASGFPDVVELGRRAHTEGAVQDQTPPALYGTNKGVEGMIHPCVFTVPINCAFALSFRLAEHGEALERMAALGRYSVTLDDHLGEHTALHMQLRINAPELRRMLQLWKAKPTVSL